MLDEPLKARVDVVLGADLACDHVDVLVQVLKPRCCFLLHARVKALSHCSGLVVLLFIAAKFVVCCVKLNLAAHRLGRNKVSRRRSE